jgi:hypothetical protein
MEYLKEQRPGYEGEPDRTHSEHAGVLHLVHAWVQQSQKSKVTAFI